MNKLIYVCCMVISLGASMHCSSKDFKKTEPKNDGVVVACCVIKALDLTAIKAHAQKMKVDQQVLPEKKTDCLESGQPLSISRGGSFHSKVDVLRLLYYDDVSS